VGGVPRWETLAVGREVTTVLVTGATGLLGPWLAEAAEALGEVVRTGLRGGDVVCDLTSPEAAARLVRRSRPGVILHAAAATDVDRCERDPGHAARLNQIAVENVVREAKRSMFVLISTDQVYPDSQGPHAEHSAAPINVYGRSKLAGERIALSYPNALVLRTNMFGPSRTEGRESLSDYVVRSLESREPATFFTDVLFSPLHLRTLARLIVQSVQRGLRGCFNAGSRNGFSKYDFAVTIARHRGLPIDDVRAGSSDAVRGHAPRPHDLRLDVGRIESALDIVMPEAKDEVGKL
jgi:dTDP-4-dehydrorhamnose reductase